MEMNPKNPNKISAKRLAKRRQEAAMGLEYVRNLIDWEMDPGDLPDSYNPGRATSDLNLHYKDVFEGPELT